MFLQRIQTDRLHIEELSHADASFLIELVNTPGWLEFIGNRNVYTLFDAQNYIQNILDNENYRYWTVKLKDTNSSIGLISLIKREYLTNHDIGFAFLPQYCNLGYAFEATQAVIEKISMLPKFEILLATTLPNNIHSIKLLKRLHFSFIKKIEVNDELLNLYSLTNKKDL